MRRHRLDPFSLVFGLTFAGLGALLLDTDVDLADLSGGGWFPIPALFLGVLLLAVGLNRARPPAPPHPEPDRGGESGDARRDDESRDAAGEPTVPLR